MLDVLSRLISRAVSVLDRSEKDFILNVIDSFSVSVISVSEVFRNRVTKDYQNKSKWIRIIVIVKTNTELGDNAVRLLYKLINDLLYFDNVEIEMRLCVSIRALKHEVFKLTHDEMRHSEYARTYEKLTRGIYIYNMSTKLYKYLRHYSHCQLH